LIESADDPDVFERNLARRMAGWLLRLPAGVGLATLRATLKLLIGVPPSRSGVYSAGNGPAMRSALIGVCCGHEPARLAGLVRASTRLTHTNPRAEFGALAVALAAWMASSDQTDGLACRYLELLEAQIQGRPDGVELVRLARLAYDHRTRNLPISQFAEEIGAGNGVSGYVYQTVPIALRVWFEHPADYRAGLSAIVRLGGDTDTTGAILGAIIGARVGETGISQEWRGALIEWPQSVAWMKRLAEQLAHCVASGSKERALSATWPLLLARNALFTTVVLTHGFRRLAPPY
jgi:ADP-ribosylglycohydrolase